MRLLMVFVLLTAVFWSSVSHAGDDFPSDSYLKGGNRWEGIFDKPVSAKFGLVSFRRGLVPKYESGDVLVVSFFAPSAVQAEIKARKLKPAGKYYAMQAKRTDWQAGLNIFKPWSVDDVLVPENISDRSLAVEIRADDKTYLPGWVGLEGQPASDQYYAHIYTPLSIKSLTYAVVDPSGATVLFHRLEDISSKETVMLALDMTGAESGLYSLNISVDWKEDPDAYDPRYTFYHHRVAD